MRAWAGDGERLVRRRLGREERRNRCFCDGLSAPAAGGLAARGRRGRRAVTRDRSQNTRQVPINLTQPVPLGSDHTTRIANICFPSVLHPSPRTPDISARSATEPAVVGLGYPAHGPGLSSVGRSSMSSDLAIARRRLRPNPLTRMLKVSALSSLVSLGFGLILLLATSRKVFLLSLFGPGDRRVETQLTESGIGGVEGGALASWAESSVYVEVSRRVREEDD